MKWQFLGLLVLLLGIVFFPVRRENVVLAPTGDDSRVFFGGTTTVAQEFITGPGFTSIRVLIGTDSEVSSPRILHVRERLDGPDIRVATAGGEAVFSFRPVVRGGERKLVWVLEAPAAAAKSVWVYREQDAAAYPFGVAYVASRQTGGNFAFTAQRIWPWVLLRWEELRTAGNVARGVAEVASILVGIIIAITYPLIRKLSFWHQWPERRIIGLIIAASVILHVAVGMLAPVVHDEGAYIQDVRQAAEGLMPFRDVLTKGPFFLGMLWLWQFIIPNEIGAWRLLATVASALAVWGIWLLARELGLARGQRIWAAALLALLPGAIGLTSPLLLQVIALPLLLFGLVLAARGAQRSEPRFLLGSALLMNAAYFTRVSGAVAAMAGAILILLISKRRWRDVGIYIASGLIFFAMVFGASYQWLGWEKTAVMFNFEAALVSQQRVAVAQQVSTETDPIIRQLVIGARYVWQTAPLLLSSFLLWPLLWLTRQRPVRSLLWLAVAVALAMPIWRHLVDTQFLLPFGSLVVTYTIIGLIFVVPAVVGAWQFFYGQRWQPDTAHLKQIGWLLVWLALMAYAYGQWGRWRQNYLTEFLPPLILLFVLTVSVRQLRLPSGIMAAALGLAAASVVQGYYVLFAYPITGTIDQPSLPAIVRMVQQHVPVGTPLFTAQPIITAFADRPIMFGYSHPGWYREAKLGTLPAQLLAIFFQDPDKLTDYLAQEAQFVVMEGRTGEIYFDGYPERREILERLFEKVAEADNAQEGEKVFLFRRIFSETEREIGN